MQLDESQKAVVRHHGSRAMVLAGPGCGKTHILAERVAYAHTVHGIDFSDMLCLTFTNRAARGMRERIAARLGEIPEGLFVGNLHRFCIRFLHRNGLISPDTQIIDEDDAASFIDSRAGMAMAGWRNEVMATAVDRYMASHDYPAAVRRKLWFVPNDWHISCAIEYERFKRDHNMMDFDDCLLWTYDALRDSSPDLEDSRFGWVQVDEVQDLSPLQTAIVSLLAPKPDATVLYLGDEQQAIFDFLGAGAEVLARVRESCGGRILHLNRNYRSTAPLLELCNTFAVQELQIDPAFLPDVGSVPAPDENSISLWHPSADVHVSSVVGLAKKYLSDYPDETTTILVRTNAELECVHKMLDKAGVEHMAVGARDAFRSVAFKTLFAHFAVAATPLRTTDWARLLYQTGCLRRLEDAAELVAEMREAAMIPADLLSPDGLTAVERAVVAIESGKQLPENELMYLCRLLFPSRRWDSVSELLELFGGGKSDGRPYTDLQRYIAPMLTSRYLEQERLSELRGLSALREKFYARYGAIYEHTQRMLESEEIGPENTLEGELDYVYREFVLKGYIRPIPRWPAMLSLLGGTVTDSRAEPRLREQLEAHLHELCTFNEGDLYDRGLAERLSVLTVHKAKGLEMDNVIVFNANTFWGSRLDRARIFYVAFSRARKRLAVFYSKYLSESLESVEHLFHHVSRIEADRLASDV